MRIVSQISYLTIRGFISWANETHNFFFTLLC